MGFRGSHKLLILNFQLLLILFFTACNKKECVENNKQCICNKIYQPVCGCNDVTYGNSCEAECKGIEYSEGSCK